MRSALLAALALLAAEPSARAATPDEAARLRGPLTPLGAERAGNTDGSIPAWTGGTTRTEAGWSGSGPRPDPYAGERPLFSITAANVDKYKSKLAAGFVEFFQRYPSEFRIDVYPTHRTAAAPQWVYDNTMANATSAHTENGGLTVAGAYGGIPFPIAKTGYEAMINMKLGWKGESILADNKAIVFPSDGSRVLASQQPNYWGYPFYYRNAQADFGGIYWYVRSQSTAPAYKVGEGVVGHYYVDDINHPNETWQYLPGQRRVRRAPNFLYDTPNFFISGAAQVDEFLTFNGPLDRYDFKLLGKQEMYIPYNDAKFNATPTDAALGRHFPNPDVVRWELHRVWVIEGTVLPGKRNAIARRRLYLDEDTWNGVAADEYDSSGELWRMTYNLTFDAPEIPAVLSVLQMYHDFKANVWVAGFVLNDGRNQWVQQERRRDSFYSPDTIAAESTR